jgi:hypothetical protein
VRAEIQAAPQTHFAPTPTSGILQRKCACGKDAAAGGECEECRKKRQGSLQRAATGLPPVGDVAPIVHEVLRYAGQPLDAATRAFMEPRFGHDFSRVRVHTDERAAQSARAVNSLAYTVGPDIVFGAQQYAPGSVPGRRLLAHELAHAVQQSNTVAGSTVNGLRMGAPDDQQEREAETQAQVVETGTVASARKLTSSGPSLQRQPKPEDPTAKPAKAETASCMRQATKHIFSRGNDDPAECQYETARTTVRLLYDPCACAQKGVTSLPLRLEYSALMGGKSFSDEAGTQPETQASQIAGQMNLEETGGGAASGPLIHTEDTGKKSKPGDPGDTLKQTLDLQATVPCKSGTASGSVGVGMTSPGTPRYVAEAINWSITIADRAAKKASLSIDETTPPNRVTTKTIDVTGGKKAYPKFPGTPRDKGCTCHKVTGAQVGKNCSPKGGAGFGPTGGG